MRAKSASFTCEKGPPIRGLDHFLSEIKRFAGAGDFRLYFRGQGTPVQALLPSIGRRHFYLDRALDFDAATEARLLRAFRRHAYEHFGRIASEWETLFLARHHGLPTRLLDWTSNPLVALYFAAFYESEAMVPEGRNHGRPKLNLDGTIWAIQRQPDLEELDVFQERRSPLQIPGIKLVFPINPTPRMTAQSGVFTLHSDPWSDLMTCAGKHYRRGELDIAKLICWPIEGSCKKQIVLDLERVSINSRTLFPDLEGLAKGLWQTEIIRRCFEAAGPEHCHRSSSE